MSRAVGGLYGALLALAVLPLDARADLGPNSPSPCDGKVERQPCDSAGGVCVKKGRHLVCTAPLDPSAYPPVPDPWASTTAPRPPAPTSSSSAAPTESPKSGCSCALPGATPDDAGSTGHWALAGLAIAGIAVRRFRRT